MQLNLSAEMIHALYCAAKTQISYDYSHKEYLQMFVDLVDDYVDDEIQRLLEKTRNNSEPL